MPPPEPPLTDRPASPDPPPADLLATRHGFDGQRVRVRVDDVRLPSGRRTEREVVETRETVVVLPITADGRRLLLIRQYHHAIGRPLLGLPADVREPNEDPTATARRELIEETGFAPGRLTPLLAFYSSPGFTAALPGLLAPGPHQIQEAKTLIGLLWFLRDAGSIAGGDQA